MILTAGNVFYYLQDRGLASSEAVVRGDFRVVKISLRNLTFRVTSGTGGELILKQVQTWTRPYIALFEAEAHWYWLGRNSSVLAPLSSLFSRCLGYDAENQILILNVPAGCEDLDRHFKRLGGIPAESGQLLGETLAALHYRVAPSTIHEVRQDFARQLPSALRWHEIEESSRNGANPGPRKAGHKLMRLVKENGVFREAFARLSDGWRAETLINGDMKFAHCILNSAGMYFVDWECGDIGDPCWDTGAIFQEFLSAWILSIPRGSPDSLDDRTANARTPIEQIQPAIRTFWQSYVKRAGFDEFQAAEKLRRSVDYAAAWLIQTAYQHVKDEAEIGGQAVSMIQLSLNILADRERATHELLGL
jgi:hypothetical protein